MFCSSWQALFQYLENLRLLPRRYISLQTAHSIVKEQFSLCLYDIVFLLFFPYVLKVGNMAYFFVFPRLWNNYKIILFT